MLPCVVLAGGLGTRMRPATEAIPKALIPVGGRPFAEIQLEWLAGAGVERVIYSIGYRGGMVRDVLGDGGRLGLRIEYVDEGDELRGTAGALRLALDLGVLPDAFFLLNGDSYLRVDFREVEAKWSASGLPALMTVYRNQDRWDRSNAVLQGDRVLYDKSRAALGAGAVEWIDYGLSVLTRDVIAQAVPAEGYGDIADALRDLSLRGLLGAYEVNKRFYEAGSPEGLHDLESFLARSH